MLREESHEALPARFWKAAVGAPCRGNDAIECAVKERINTRRIIGFYGIEFGVEFPQRHVGSFKRLASEVCVAISGHSVCRNFVRRLYGLIDSRQQRNDETRYAAYIWTGSQPTAKRRTTRKPGHDSQQQAKTTPQPGMQIVTNRVALCIKSGFVKGSLIGLRRGDWHFRFLRQVLAGPAFGQAMVLGCAFPGLRTCFSPAGWLMWISILADVNADVLGMTAGRDRHPNYLTPKEIT